MKTKFKGYFSFPAKLETNFPTYLYRYFYFGFHSCGLSEMSRITMMVNLQEGRQEN